MNYDELRQTHREWKTSGLCYCGRYWPCPVSNLLNENATLRAVLNDILATVRQPSPEHTDAWHVAAGMAEDFRLAIYSARALVDALGPMPE